MKKLLVLICLFLTSSALASEIYRVNAQLTSDRKGWGKTGKSTETVHNQPSTNCAIGSFIIKNEITSTDGIDILIKMTICKKMPNGQWLWIAEPTVKSQWNKLITVQLPTITTLNELSLLETEDITVQLTALSLK